MVGVVYSPISGPLVANTSRFATVVTQWEVWLVDPSDYGAVQHVGSAVGAAPWVVTLERPTVAQAVGAAGCGAAGWVWWGGQAPPQPEIKELPGERRVRFSVTDLRRAGWSTSQVVGQALAYLEVGAPVQPVWTEPDPEAMELSGVVNVPVELLQAVAQGEPVTCSSLRVVAFRGNRVYGCPFRLLEGVDLSGKWLGTLNQEALSCSAGCFNPHPVWGQ